MIEIIDKILTEDYYIHVETSKNKICLMGTSLKSLDHINRISQNLDNQHKQAPMFTVDEDGIIYNHFNPKYYSKIFDDSLIDKSTISIALSNLGPLQFNYNNNSFNNLFNIPVDLDQIYEQEYGEYRGFRYWHKHSEKQTESIIKLCSFLCKEYDIKNRFIGHVFTMEENIYDYKGIVTRPNINPKYMDINPSLNFRSFYKNNIFIK